MNDADFIKVFVAAVTMSGWQVGQVGKRAIPVIGAALAERAKVETFQVIAFAGNHINRAKVIFVQILGFCPQIDIVIRI